MDETAGGVTFRAYRPEDIPFLMDSWGSSYRKSSHTNRQVSVEDFHAFHRPIRERFFSKPNTAVIVACSSDDEWYIMGWIAVESIPSGLILHYIYVRATAKGEGLSSQLAGRALPSRPVFYSHLTDHAMEIMRAVQSRGHRLDQFYHCPHLV